MADPNTTRRRIRWTTDAVNDLEQISAYIMKQNPTAARDVIRAITDGISRLEMFSNLGRTGQVEGTRELVFTSLPYIGVYRVKEKAVEILRVYHAAQDWP
jgi:addiction module RelE/StbE family toxin